MKLHVGFLLLLMELCSRMQVCVSICLLSQMTSLLCLLILFGSAVTSPLGLEDVFFSPQDQTVKEGEAVFLQCVSGESSPAANVSWLKDGRIVTRGRQFQGEYGGGQQKKTSGTLHLFNATLQDDGIYVCVAHNSLLNISRRSKPAKLTVEGVPLGPKLVQGPDNITVTMGTEVSMQCTVRGFPVPMVHWFKDGCLLSRCSATFSLLNNGQLLILRNVTKQDEGWYHCEASIQEETIKSQSAFLLLADMQWSFVQQPSSLTVRRGENVTLTCRPPYSRPEADVSWFKGNQLLSPAVNMTVLPSGDLFFHSIQEHDGGVYFCRASNSHLQRFLTSRRATLTVLAPPLVKLWPTVLMVPVGAPAVLECEVSGHPLPSISWMKRGHSKQTGGKVALGQRNATLYIQSARIYDEAVYVCEASNVLGRSHSTALLRVAVSPIIVTFASRVSSTAGSSVVLPCRAVGVQPITYSWTRAETRSPISRTETKHVDENGALHISRVQHSDAGEFVCTAENRAGRHQRCTVLTVTAEDRPAYREKQTKLVLSASSNVSKDHHVSAEQNLQPAHHPHLMAQQKITTCFSCSNTTTSPAFSRKFTAELKAPPSRPDQILEEVIHPAQQLVATQIQPPILPPPPHPNFLSGDLNPKLPLEKDQHLTSTSPPLGSTPAATSQGFSPTSTSPHQFLQSKENNESPVNLKYKLMWSETPVPTQISVSQIKIKPSDSVKVTSERESYHLKPHSFHQRNILSKNETSSHISPNKPTALHFSASPQQTTHWPATPLSFLPKFHLESPDMQLPPSLITRPPPLQFDDRPTAATLNPGSSQQHHPVSDPVNTSHVYWVNQANSTQKDQASNSTKLTDWKKRNTSQSPMTSNNPIGTQQSPSWLPALEKHDIPIVVGVGISLAFIFITVTFYSVVQKNEPLPPGRAATSLAAQRNLGVPKRHADRQAAGHTYENRAFEDDDSVTVIEQSPNTSDTRARPPGPSLVIVQMEPTFEEIQDVCHPAADHYSVTVETHPEPIVDTKIDSSLEEDKRCSLSLPSIQLQSTEDWTSISGDNHSACQDAFPPPSSLPSRSPSPPSRREDALHSSLTLRSAEPCAAPIHHSLSISHGSPPLLVSHHVSLGLTSVAVDVQVYPAASASTAVSSSTHINSASNSASVTAPLFSPPLFNSQENDDQSTGRLHQSK
ncbi:roundabout homolog 2-like [Xiphophorus maculatus]|uniref:roundabout homolog 2-like n=1 Tax=Xiphophorus maculatus TaxID=8083 RepID=UPI000C6D7567|nr:roundabout homolog 2-like [Xiphophorus maculatus]